MEPGNYTLQAIYNGEDYRYNQEYRRYSPSASEIITLEIREGFWKQQHPGHTLPTEYWSRPVDSQLREWYILMGSWLQQKPRNTNLFAPYNDAPTTAHILWSTPVGDTPAGLSGGATGDIGFQSGDAYEGKFSDSIIVAGVLYYNRYVSNSPRQTVVAVDLHTGETLWERDYDFGSRRVSRGQIFNYISENNRGTWAYLWMVSGTNMFALDPVTGDLIYNMTNVPSGTFYIGPSGEMLKYRAVNHGTVANPHWYLQQWNSTYVVLSQARQAGRWGSQIQGQTFNANCFDVNVSLSGTFVPGQTTTGAPSGTSQIANPIAAFPCDRVIFGNVSRAGVTLTGITLDPESLGYPLFSNRFTAATGDWTSFTSVTATGTDTQSGWAAFSNDPYIGVFWTKEDRINHVFSIETGRLLWESEPQNFADSWGGATSNSSPEKIIVYGKLIEGSGGGIIYCYNATTGVLDWTFEQKDKYMESYHRENWWAIPCFVSSGMVFFGYQVHSTQVPMPRGAPFYALDVETGKVVWQIDGAFRQSAWGGRAMIGDSIIVTMDTYDQLIYGVGKGPSKTTVTSSNAVTTAGSTVLISGTVMDISPATEQHEAQKRFPMGVPAVSDESMSNWMLYVYKNFARPEDTVGVKVTVFAQQGDDHVIDIGTTVSDASGRFAIPWTPPADATGNWDIYAYFDGSGAYWGSWTKSEMVVLEAPVVVEPETPPYGWYIAGAVIVIIVAIAINIYVTLRKK